MTAYQVWRDANGHDYVPSCAACGDMMRSSPAYDGIGPCCRRKACRRARGAKPMRECMCFWTTHYTGEGCPFGPRPTQATNTP